ncbi:Transcriptional regulatory protein XylR [Georgfuchsia toluolica]|uniref:Transcriptional regulatory protein XylR n=1 Tax=Georgfuchsia toluolica TaxID=424218 RepID=A0A916J023_9PROT|nr:sigma-54-dependent Fis family transcriptional regulator [Georgfuchsia toluolica]CAG4882123.1 Transcriptional regulatory protein XylR [Georgfuchsia toluolica]CAG4885459.1 Transcriptional regulatory protein XylR [Georgfuchsia toluolica]
MNNTKYPHIGDLRRLIRFSTVDGTIWLAENRMLLMHAATLAGLRREIISSVGSEHARRILTRIGYQSGIRDAELACKIRGRKNLIDSFAGGPQLHMLEGNVRVSKIKLDMDIAKGTFYGEFLWGNSWEAEAHVKEYGPQTDPACWMLIGHASGFSSAFMGRFILFKEVECAACGPAQCRIVGKPAEDWPDAAEHTRYYEEDSIFSRLLDLHKEVDVLRSSLNKQRQVEDLIGVSPAFQKANDLMLRAANTNVTVLLLGETGVGKERFARALHDSSSRKDAPFVAVNCAALPPDLIDSELFGAEKGAFTGAHASRVGRFERADGGTLFLDEIGELPLTAQAKILRVLQGGEVERLGGNQTRKVNVRIIAATNVDLKAAVKNGEFRSDLFYRLNVYPIWIPPLRDRPLDIPPLVEAMIAKFSTEHAKRDIGITDKALKALTTYHWPGNVRELENMIERGIILASAGCDIEISDLFPSPDDSVTNEEGVNEGGRIEEKTTADEQLLCDAIMATGMPLDEIESMLLRNAVESAKGNLAAAARILGITRAQLTYRLKRGESTPQLISESSQC